MCNHTDMYARQEFFCHDIEVIQSHSKGHHKRLAPVRSLIALNRANVVSLTTSLVLNSSAIRHHVPRHEVIAPLSSFGTFVEATL